MAPFPSSRHRMVELLWSFAPAYQRWSESLLVEKGLSPQWLRILGSIHERSPRIMSDLKKELGVTATNVTALVDSLEKDGLVVQRRHPTDRRTTVIERSDLNLPCGLTTDRRSLLPSISSRTPRARQAMEVPSSILRTASCCVCQLWHTMRHRFLNAFYREP